MKRRDLERHLRTHGCRQIDEAETMRGGPARKASDRSSRVTARSTMGWRERSAVSLRCHRQQARADPAQRPLGDGWHQIVGRQEGVGGWVSSARATLATS
jgi:hypothetical protein